MYILGNKWPKFYNSHTLAKNNYKIYFITTVYIYLQSLILTGRKICHHHHEQKCCLDSQSNCRSCLYVVSQSLVIKWGNGWEDLNASFVNIYFFLEKFQNNFINIRKYCEKKIVFIRNFRKILFLYEICRKFRFYAKFFENLVFFL